MRAADKGAEVDTMHGASLRTRTASGTKLVVDRSKIVLNGNSTVGTGLLALHTADTTVRASRACLCTLVVVRAFYNDSCGVFDKVYDSVGTGACANATADTLGRLDLSNSALDRNSTVGAGGGTVAASKAGVRTKLLARVEKVLDTAAVIAAVLVLLLRRIARAVTGNVCNTLNNVLSLKAKYACDTAGSSVTTGNAKVGFYSLTLGKRLCISVTSGIAASATVSTGKTVADSNNGRVLLDGEILVRQNKKHVTNNRNTKEDTNSNENIDHVSTSLYNTRKACERHSDDRRGDKGDGNSAEGLGCGAVLDS